MNEEHELQRNYGILADMLVAKISRYMILLAILLSVMNTAFVPENRTKYLLPVCIITMIGLLFPTFIYNLIDKHKCSYSYIVLIIIASVTAFFYTALSGQYDVIFVFPVLLSCLYNKEKICIGTGIFTETTLFLAKIIKYALFRYEFPDIGWGELIVNNIIPPMLILGVICIGCVIITDRFKNLIDQILLAARNIEQKHKDMNTLIESLNNLIDAQKLMDSNELLPAVAKIIIKLTHVNTVHPFPFLVAMIKSDESGWDVLNYGSYSITNGRHDVHVGFDKRAFSFKYEKDPNISENDLFNHDIYGVSFPFYSENKLIGFAIFSVRMPVDTRESLVSAHAMITKALSNCILNKKLFSTQEELCFNLAEVCEAKSSQTGQHVKRIAKYMEIFGESLGLSPLENKVVSVASMLHDVGKLDIPISILDKPGKLTDEEYEIIKSHTRVGYDMLKNCSGVIMQRAAMMALEHHERWDGKGYNHIKGEEIDFFSRYVAVADVFDALSSKRSYKEAWSLEDVKNEIVRCKGTQFCPDAVDRFVANFDKFAKVRESMPD